MGSHGQTPDFSSRPSSRFPKSLGGDVHVWRLFLDLPVEGVQALRGFLAEDEIERADRFHQETDRTRFIIGRGLLRCLLARYLNVRPNEIRFQYNPWGKPYLSLEIHPSAPMFNFSHSQDLALCALSRDRMIGVDIEHVRNLVGYADIAERFFSIQEIEAIAAQPEPMRQRAFFSCWTQKEAFVKALGQGLSIHLNRFNLPMSSPNPTSVTYEGSCFLETSRWSLLDLNLGADYVGSIAVEGDMPRVHCWKLQEKAD